MKILTIIVTYNGLQWYERCFGSLLRSTISVDIMVVDNASQDGSADWIAEHYPEINLIRSDKNLGFGQANNIGLRYALDHGYDYVFLLNQDAWLHTNDCIERLVKAAKNYPEYMIMSALWLYGSGERITKGSKQHMIAMEGPNNDFVSDLYLGRALKEVYETDCIGAAAWLLSRETLEQIGGFDPLFFHRGEDENYMQRVHYHGGKIGLCAKACICHDIEERPASYEITNTREKGLLIELANPNYDNRICQLRKKFFIQVAHKVLFLRWNKVKTDVKYLNFILSKTKRIEKSQLTNRMKGRTWL